MPGAAGRILRGWHARCATSGSARRIFSPSSTAWRWTRRRTSARPIGRRSISIATGSRARSGGCRSACSASSENDGIALAHHLGRALQLTNILRDIDEDAEIGRLYLPREALREAGIVSDDPMTALAKPALPQVCEAVVARARGHFQEADAIMARNPRRAVRAPRIMEEVYRVMLQGMAVRGWAPPRTRVRVSGLARCPGSPCSTQSSDGPHRPHYRCRPGGACSGGPAGAIAGEGRRA